MTARTTKKQRAEQHAVAKVTADLRDALTRAHAVGYHGQDGMYVPVLIYADGPAGHIMVPAHPILRQLGAEQAPTLNRWRLHS